MDYLTKITASRPQPSSVPGVRSLVDETESNRGRIIQSAAIRRLQQKTQVYPLETNAAVRSRLTHSLEVQQTGRYLAKTILQRLKEKDLLKPLNLEGLETAFTNLVEMSCLMHDVGNPPFGHFGEAAISRWMSRFAEDCHSLAVSLQTGHTKLFTEKLLPDLSEFEGNAQGLRIIQTLQELNLTWSQIAALIKYTRPPYKHPISQQFRYRQKKPGYYFSEEHLIKAMNHSLEIGEGCRFPLTYIMEAADDISYCIADLEDSIDKGIFTVRGLCFWLQDIWSELIGEDNDYLPKIIQTSLSRAQNNPHQFIVRLRTALIGEMVDYAADRYIAQHPAIFNGTLDEPLINGGSNQHLALLTLREVAFRHIFSSHEKETPELRGYAALIGLMDIFKPLLELSKDVFLDIAYHDKSEHFIEQKLYHRLSSKYKNVYLRTIEGLQSSTYSQEEQNDLEWYYRTRLIIDYISGMTDHFVVTEYQNLSAI